MALLVNTYDRMFDEPEDAWTAFYRYRNVPNPRSGVDVWGLANGYSAARLKAWYARHDWAARLCAWDQRVDGTRQAATLRGVEEMAARHIGLAKRMIAVAETAVARIESDFKSDFHRMKPHEISRVVEVATKLERLSRGEATERVDGEGQDYSRLTDDDLAALEQISRRL